MTRYAIYGIPGVAEDDAEEAIALRLDAEAWFARDDVFDISVSARRYGFHATIKAPFRLADGVDDTEFARLVSSFAASREPVVIPALRQTTIGGFRALVPGGDHQDLESLAADVVRNLDHLRAPLAEHEVARRRPESLTSRQRELLETWGYPFVLDEFLLHMTLTDRLDGARGAAIDNAIAAHFAERLGIDVPLTSLVVCVEPEPGANFAIHSIHPLGGIDVQEQA